MLMLAGGRSFFHFMSSTSLLFSLRGYVVLVLRFLLYSSFQLALFVLLRLSHLPVNRVLPVRRRRGERNRQYVI